MNSTLDHQSSDNNMSGATLGLIVNLENCHLAKCRTSKYFSAKCRTEKNRQIGKSANCRVREFSIRQIVIQRNVVI